MLARESGRRPIRMTRYRDDDHPVIRSLLEPGEQVQHQAQAYDAVVAVTDRRLAVVEAERVALAIDITQLRRVQFDIEKTRPATLVIVPEDPLDAPQSLAVAPEHYDDVASLLVTVGRRLAAAG
jgi:hypothetical protein